MKRLSYAVLIFVVGSLFYGCATSNGTGNFKTDIVKVEQRKQESTVCRNLSGNNFTSLPSLFVVPEDISNILERDAENKNLEKITTQADIPMIVNKKVLYFINYFSETQHKIFTKWLERSERYIPQMKRVLKENGLPEDLVYIALIESGFNIHAASRRNAIGPWQFIRSTAKLYNLKVNWWVDERKNPGKSTLAAARYLKSLHDTFGSWYLAEAAYNAGPLKIMNAMRRQHTDNFWKLAEHRYLKRETRDYVPKLIAAAMIARNPSVYGFTDLIYEKPIEDDQVVLHHQMDIHVAAKLAGVGYKTIKRLNPELLRWATPPVFSYVLNIPAGTKQRFLAGIKNIPFRKQFSYKRYIIKKGDTLYALARDYRVSVRELRSVNRIRNVRRLRLRHAIIIPVSPYARKRVIAYRRSKKVNIPYMQSRLNSRYIYYRVKHGDTLWDIAQKFDVTVSKIRHTNSIKGRLIKPDMILKIPKIIARED